MFWRKKNQPETPKQAQILKAYLSSSLPLVLGKCSDPCVKAGVQVFILGMADMFRQSERLDWSQFIAVYTTSLSDYGLLPSKGIEAFIQEVGDVASRNEDVAKLMRYGAQSIRMYVVERDANAPTDLLSVALFAEKNGSSFKSIASA
jgi:hypothetical protein